MFADINKQSVKLHIPTKIFVDSCYELTRRYTQDVQRATYFEVKQLDFKSDAQACVETMNDWVGKFTKRRINKLLDTDAVDGSTCMVLVNAVFFDGAMCFRRNRTLLQSFYCADGSVRQVEMMQDRGSYRLHHDSELGMTYVRVKSPATTNRFSLCVFLPDTRYGVSELEARLTQPKMLETIGSVEKEAKGVQLELPKFTIETGDTDMKGALGALGVHDIFDARMANLRGMRSQDDLVFSSFVHKSRIEVKDGGGFADYSRADRPTTFIRCDHAFMFAVVDRTNTTVLLYGKIVSLGE